MFGNIWIIQLCDVAPERRGHLCCSRMLFLSWYATLKLVEKEVTNCKANPEAEILCTEKYIWSWISSISLFSSKNELSKWSSYEAALSHICSWDCRTFLTCWIAMGCDVAQGGLQYNEPRCLISSRVEKQIEQRPSSASGWYSIQEPAFRFKVHEIVLTEAKEYRLATRYNF